MSSADDKDAVGALAPRAGDPPLADGVRSRARTGVAMTRMQAAVKTASNASVYLASRSLIRNCRPSVRSPRSMSVFRACWTVYVAVGWAVTPARWTRAMVVLDDDQHIEPPKEDGVDVEEVDRGNRLGLGRQELLPAGGCASRRGVDSGFLENLPDSGGRDHVPEPCQFAADSPVAPVGFSVASRPMSAVIPALTAGRPVRVRISPLARHQPAMPPEHGAGCHQPAHPQRSGQEADQRDEHRAVRQSSRGRGWVRRSTATSCRSTSSSMSLDAVEPPSRTSQPQSRTKMR